MANKLTEEEKATLLKEVSFCRTNLSVLNETLDDLTKKKQITWGQFIHWRDRFNTADRKLAFNERLTIIKGKTGSSIIRSMKNLLKNKVKLKELIDVLEEERKG